MDSDLVRWTTLTVAVWGALAGTLALFLEFRKFRRDRSILTIKPSFREAFQDRFPPNVHLAATIANTGQRPVFLANIWVRARPSNWRQWLLWRMKPKRGWIHERDLEHQHDKLEPGQSTELWLKLPKGLPPHMVERVEVVDQSGTRWRSTRRFNQSRIRAVLEAKTLEEAEVSGTKSGRKVFLQRVRVGKKEGVLIREVKDNGARWQLPRLGQPRDAEEMYRAARTAADRYVEGELDDVLAELKCW